MGDNTKTINVPDLIPVRMLNEHVYCPRLAHLEWASQLFADNDYTVDGRWQHRAVDVQSGAAPVPDQGDLIEARSLELSSKRYGLIGVADIVEGASGSVLPIEIKRGRPAPTSERVWPPELVQLRALGLLLSDNGYECTEGAVFFVETRERVRVEFTKELTAQTIAAIAELRHNANMSEPPPRLEDSRRCNGCSLAGICLPDEIPFLRRKRLDPPRRLMPADDAAKPVYVTQPGSFVGKSAGRLVVSKNRQTVEEVRLVDVSQLCVFGNVQVSTQLVRELMVRDAPVCWFSSGGWLNGITEGMPSKHVELRRRQAKVTDEIATEIAKAMIEGKIKNSRTLLRRNSRDKNKDSLDLLKKLAKRTQRAESVAQLLGYEGTAARVYFKQFPTMIRNDGMSSTFSFKGRNRRPPKDPINCLLSFTYSLLTKDCLATLRSVGFDPYQGFLHRPRFGRPALALDLAEEFRPVISDSVAINLINNGEISARDFITRAGGVSLTAEGRKTVLNNYERRLATEITHPTFGYRVTWRRIIEVQSRILAATVLGELERYQPMLTR